MERAKKGPQGGANQGDQQKDATADDNRVTAARSKGAGKEAPLRPSRPDRIKRPYQAILRHSNRHCGTNERSAAAQSPHVAGADQLATTLGAVTGRALKQHMLNVPQPGRFEATEGRMRCAAPWR